MASNIPANDTITAISTPDVNGHIHITLSSPATTATTETFTAHNIISVEGPRLALNAGSTQEGDNHITFPNDVRLAGWISGAPIEGPNLMLNSVITGFSTDGTVVEISTRASASGSDGTFATPSIVVVAATSTSSDSEGVHFADSVFKLGWRIGLPISGPNIPPDVTIGNIKDEGETVVLSRKPTGVGKQQPGVFTVAPLWGELIAQGTVNADESSVVQFDYNVRKTGWPLGLLVESGAFAPGTTIKAFEADGHRVVMSQKASATGLQTLIVAPKFGFGLSLPHGLPTRSTRFATEAFSTAASTTPSGTPLTDGITIYSGGSPIAAGTVQWSGQILAPSGFALRGIVSSGVTGQAIGQIWLQGDGSTYISGDNFVSPLITHFPANLVAALNDNFPTSDYWSSVPACDTVTAPQKQSAVDAIGLQNQFQAFFRRP